MPSDAEILADEAKRINRALGPVMAGLIIDVVDVATFGPLGMVLGLPVGGAAGYWMGRTLGLGKQACLYCALAAGMYCTIPFTELLPLGTIVGAYARYRQEGKEHQKGLPANDTNGRESSLVVEREKSA
jgi:hypothetical protein